MKLFNLKLLIFFPLLYVLLSGCEEDSIQIIPEKITSIDSAKTVIPTLEKSGSTQESILKADYYVSPDGDDINPGTIDKPFRTWQKAFTSAKPGNLIYIRGGVYTPQPTYRNNNKASDHCGVWIKNKGGTVNDTIKIWAYPGEIPILDLKSWNYPFAKRGIMIEEESNADYWHIKGLKIRNISQQVMGFSVGIFLYGADNNKIEDCETYNIGGPGMYGTDNSSNPPNSNTYLNCDSHNNFDNLSSTPGGNADGFQMFRGNNTKYINCRSWNNSDDGWDFFYHAGKVTLEGCWAFNNGFASGDGCGFKLGSQKILKMPGSYSRVLKNCIAFYNKNVGFYENQSHINMYLANNTSFNNGTKGKTSAGAGFQFYYNSVGDTAILVNNISLNDFKGNSFNSTVIQKNNSWNNMNVNESDFVSIDTTGVSHARSNGILPNLNFLKLNKASNLIDKGANMGDPYMGTAPDLGAFEIK